MLAQSEHYNKYNISNPRPQSVARLAYGQELCILLPDPESLSEASYTSWSFFVDGHYLKLTGDRDIQKKGETFREIIFKQERVPQGWQFLSNLLLANIRIYLNKGNERELYSSVFAYLSCDRVAKQQVVTIVNPVFVNTQEIHIEKNQVLELVVPDFTSTKLNWQTYCFPVNDCTSDLQLLHKETIPSGEDKGIAANNHLFAVERRITIPSVNKETNNQIDEHHFFFGFKDKTPEVKESGNFLIHRLFAVGKGVDGGGTHVIADRQVDIHFRHKASKEKKKKQVDFSKSLLTKDSLIERRDYNFSGFKKLINPKADDAIYISENDTEYLVEIAKPESLFKDKLAGFSYVSWVAEIQSVKLKDKYSDNLEVEKQQSKYVQDVEFDIFKIKIIDPKKFQSITDKELSLGKLVIYCPIISSIIPDSERVIQIFFKKSDKNTSLVSSNINSKPVKITTYKTNANNQLVQVKNNKTKQKKQTNAFDDYFSVDLSDVGTELITGEVITYLNYDTSITNQAYLSGTSDNFYVNQVVSQKKKTSGLDDSQELNKIGWKEKQVLINKISDLSENPNIKTNTQTKDIKVPVEIFWPINNQQITLQRAQKLLINLKLPLDKQSNVYHSSWSVNPINVMAKEGFTLWISENKIVKSEDGLYYQQVEVKPLTPKGDISGSLRIGSLKFNNGNSVVEVIIILDLNKDNTKEDLQWHLDYWRALKKAQPIQVNNFNPIEVSKIQNRTTIINRLGETIDIAIKEQHEVEIILNRPLNRNKASLGWKIKPTILGGGSLDVIDSSVYINAEGEKIFRFLLHAKRSAPRFFAEIRIFWETEDTNTRICLFADTDIADCTDKINPNFIKGIVKTTKDANDKSITVNEWSDGEKLIITANDYVNISFPTHFDLFNKIYQERIRQSNPIVYIKEKPLDGWIYSSLFQCSNPPIDKLNPYYKNKGWVSDGNIPWENRQFSLPPLEQSQPHIYSIIEKWVSFNKDKTLMPLGEVVFACHVPELFTITQRLPLFLDIVNKSISEKVIVINPTDKSEINLKNQQILSVSLSSEEDQSLIWNCVSNPNWMIRLNYEYDKNNSFEIFNFKVDLQPEVVEARDFIKFNRKSSLIEESVQLTVQCFKN